jgi:hypothetical protein
MLPRHVAGFGGREAAGNLMKKYISEKNLLDEIFLNNFDLFH